MKTIYAQLRDNFVVVFIAAIYIILIVNCILIDRGYYEIMANDLFFQFDGAYRVHLGQIPHRDFSTVVGPLQFMLPAIFINYGFDALTSFRLYNAMLLIFSLPIVLYIINNIESRFVINRLRDFNCFHPRLAN